jgi:hypothetical protein
LVQPIAPDDVAEALAEIAVAPPLDGTVELAGSEAICLDELARLILSAHEDPRRVIADPRARFFGAALGRQSLIPGPNPRLCPSTLRDWLRHSSLISDASYVIDQQPLLVFFLLEEDLESVADIEGAERSRVGAEHRHVLKALRRHRLPGGMEIVLGAAGDDVPAHQSRNGRLYYSRRRQMADDIGLADDARSPPIPVAHDEELDMGMGKGESRGPQRRVDGYHREAGRSHGT